MLSTMETTVMDQFQTLYPNRRPNEAALFVSNMVRLPQSPELPIYEGQQDQFMSRESVQRQNTISLELWKKADEEKNKLFDLIAQVQTRLNKTKGPRNTTNLRTCKWDEVMAEVENTGQKWKNSPSRTAKARRCLERLGQDSGALQAWVGLLPAGDYGSSICGAFKLAIGAASRFHDVQDCVFDALIEIPEAMENARRYVVIYQEQPDQRLERKTFDLYLAVLRALNQIMQFLKDDKWKKFFGTVGQQGAYKAELFKSVQEVKKLSGKIKEEALYCSAERQGRMDMTANQTLQGVEHGEKLLNYIYYMLHQMRETQNKRFKSTRVEKYENQSAAIEYMTRKATQIHNTKAAKKLLRTLEYDSRLVQDDLETCFNSAGTLDEKSKARGSAMAKHVRLRLWLTESTSSRALLVNGRSDLSCAEGPSPLSLVDAQLITVSEKMESAFVVKYFCGLHTLNLDPSTASSPAGMMVSLVGQLLSQMLDREVNVDFLRLEKAVLKDIKSHNLVALQIVFGELVRQLPPKALLVCVLDEVYLYETQDFREDTDDVMRRLTRLVSNTTEITFKMLVTCRGRALDFQQYFQDDILDLDEYMDRNDSAMWNITHIGGRE